MNKIAIGDPIKVLFKDPDNTEIWKPATVSRLLIGGIRVVFSNHEEMDVENGNWRSVSPSKNVVNTR